MSEPFDPYRDALVVETSTLWSDEAKALNLGAAERERIAQQAHAQPAAAAQLDYVRLATGFCRQITITPADIDRLRAKAT